MMALDIGQLTSAMAAAGEALAGNVWSQIRTSTLPELQNIATQIVTIEANKDQLTPEGAQDLLDMQVKASIGVIVEATEIVLIDVQAAINQILGAVKAQVNSAIGFALI
jgi:hypothetical protein